MLQSRDGNGSRMLSLITEQFLLDSRLSSYKSQPMPDKLRRLWDELACLWVFVVLNPTAISQDRDEWAANFEEWNSIDGCPPEDPQLPTNTQNGALISSRETGLMRNRGFSFYSTRQRSNNIFTSVRCHRMDVG